MGNVCESISFGDCEKLDTSQVKLNDSRAKKTPSRTLNGSYLIDPDDPNITECLDSK